MNHPRLTRKPSRDEIFTSYTSEYIKVWFIMVSDYTYEELYQHLIATPVPGYGHLNASSFASRIATIGEYAFAYYFQAVDDYLRSEDSRGDAETLFSILQTISFRNETMKSEFPDCQDEVVACVRYCADNIAKFDVNRTINKLQTGRDYEPHFERALRALLAQVTGDCNEVVITEVGEPREDHAAPESIPTLLDISPSGCVDLDERSAVENFLGKTFEEAKGMFFDHAERYADDLGWMGSKAFNFYFPAYAAYLKSEAADPGDFMFLGLPISIQALSNFHELRHNADVLDVLDYGIELLSKPENTTDPFNQDTLQQLVELKEKIIAPAAGD